MDSSSKHVNPASIKIVLQKYRSKHEEVKCGFLSAYEVGMLTKKTASDNTSATIEKSHQRKSCLKPFATMAKEHYGMLSLPALTEKEANSHLGASLGYLMGLLITLEQQLVAQRAASHLNSFRNAWDGTSVETTARQDSSGAQASSTSDNDGALHTATMSPDRDRDNGEATEQEQNQATDATASTLASDTSQQHSASECGKPFTKRHGSMDLASLDGLESMDDDKLFSFLKNM